MPFQTKHEFAAPTDFKNLPSKSAAVGQVAAEYSHIVKLSHDTGLTHEAIHHLAGKVQLPTIQFVKLAYADPADFAQFMTLATGQVKQAAGALGSLTAMLAKLKGAGGAALGKVDNAIKPVMTAAMPSALSGTPGRRLGSAGAILGGSGAAGAAASMGGGAPAPPVGPVPGAAEALQGMQTPPTNPAPAPAAAGPMGPPKLPPVPKAPAPPKMAPSGSATAPASKGLSRTQKGLIGAGAGAAIGAGAGVAYAKSKKKKSPEKEASDRVVSTLIFEKLAAQRRLNTRNEFCRFLDKVAAYTPLPKQAPIRTMQSELASGRSLLGAIKVAYPHLGGEERGALLSRMIHDATAAMKKAEIATTSSAITTTTPSTFSGSLSGGRSAMKSMVGF